MEHGGTAGPADGRGAAGPRDPEIVNGQLCLVRVGGPAMGKALQRVVQQRRARDVTHLDLTGNKLKRVPDLTPFKNVGTLVLDKNHLTSEKLSFSSLKSVDTVWINDNKLSNLEKMIAAMAAFPNLRYLSAMKNPCVPDIFAQAKDLEDYNRYRLYVIYRLPSLTFLDDQAITQDERARAGLTGQFSKAASPRESQESIGAAAAHDDEIDASVAGVEDDSNARKKDDSRAFLGYSPYKHLAHDSEGNRTIGSDSL